MPRTGGRQTAVGRPARRPPLASLAVRIPRPMPEPSVAYEDECFFIAPIGSEGSETRRRSDGIRDYIVKPAVEPLGLTTVRADDLRTPGQITLQVIEHVLRS